jgi:hypothetical protein
LKERLLGFVPLHFCLFGYYFVLPTSNNFLWAPTHWLCGAVKNRNQFVREVNYVKYRFYDFDEEKIPLNKATVYTQII